MEHVDRLMDAYRDGELPARKRRRVEAHLNECVHCQTELSALERLSGLLREDALPDASEDPVSVAVQIYSKIKSG